MLVDDWPLAPRLRDHSLAGEWHDHWDCHSRPDLILMYRKSGDDVLQLVRIGSHSELGLWSLTRLAPDPSLDGASTREQGHRSSRPQASVGAVARGRGSSHQHPQWAGQEPRATGAVDLRAEVEFLQPVPGISPGTVDGLVDMPRRGVQTGDHDARVVLGFAAKRGRPLPPSVYWYAVPCTSPE